MVYSFAMLSGSCYGNCILRVNHFTSDCVFGRENLEDIAIVLYYCCVVSLDGLGGWGTLYNFYGCWVWHVC